MDRFERIFLQTTLAAITATTIGNMLVNYRGTVAIAETIVAAPVRLVNALRR